MTWEKHTVSGQVSIVITCYNYAHFLPEAIESAMSQTASACEIIVVNDGSIDRTEEVAAKYPIKILNKINGGVSSARNAGIKHARGDFILPLDADDKIHPVFLEKSVSILKANPKVGVVFTHRKHFGLLGSIKEALPFDFNKMKSKCTMNYCSLYRKQVWDQCGGYDSALDGYEDWDFWLSVAERNWTFHLLPEVLFYYRKHGKSLSDFAKSNHDRLFQRLKLNHPKLFRKEYIP